jgi:hypothetical protein
VAVVSAPEGQTWATRHSGTPEPSSRTTLPRVRSPFPGPRYLSCLRHGRRRPLIRHDRVSAASVDGFSRRTLPAAGLAVPGRPRHGMIEPWRYSVAVFCYARPTRSAVAVSTRTSSDSRSTASSGCPRIRGWSSSFAGSGLCAEEEESRRGRGLVSAEDVGLDLPVQPVVDVAVFAAVDHGG